MAEVFVTFSEPIRDREGGSYIARVCGGEMEDGRWQGWIEFESLDGSGTFRSPRETTQPNRTDAAYWATGLTPVYFEGALERTLRPGPVTVEPDIPLTPVFDGPLPADTAATPSGSEAVLNPFSVYRKGEALLRRQLSALASWHLVNIIRAYELSDQSADDLNGMTAPELIELIVARVSEGSAVKG